MHLYAYGDWEPCNEITTLVDNTSDSSENEIVILLDDDDEEECANTPVSERPKIDLPKRSSSNIRNAVQQPEQDSMDLQEAAHEEEIFQSMSCMPCLRDKSLEELRLECYLQTRIATGQSPKPVSTPALSIPPSFAPWCQDGSEESLGSEVMNNKRIRLHQELEALASTQPTLASALTFGQIVMVK